MTSAVATAGERQPLFKRADSAAVKTSKPTDKPKKHRLTPRLIEALDLLATGEAKTQKEAAQAVGMAPEHLSRQLAKDHVQDYLARAAKRKISSAILRAAHVKTDLLSSESDKVRNDVASDILAIGGIAPPSGKAGGGLTIHNHGPAGYVIDLSDPGKPAIDITPER